MIFDQAIAQSCGFCLQGGVQVFSAEGLERCFEMLNTSSSDAVVSSPELSEYYRPHEVNMSASNNYRNGLTWHMAHYLQPLPLKQFLLTSPDYTNKENSPLYQNPYWPLEADQPAEK